MYSIGEFSKLSGLSINTLRHYETVRVLIPDSVNEFTGYRYYRASQLVTVNKILALKDAGFSLMEIATIFADVPSNSSIISMLEVKANELEEALNSEQERLMRLRTNIFNIKNGGIPFMNEITIKRVEPIMIVSTRKVIEKGDFGAEAKMWETVNEFIKANKVQQTIPCVALYHNGTWDWEATENWDVEVAEPITKAVAENDVVSVRELPIIERMACIVHRGSLRNIGDTYKAIASWIEQNNYSVNGSVREIYHVGEWATSNEEEYVTELQFPLAK